MKNCPYCLTLNQDFASVCEMCGQSMTTPQPRYAPGYEPFQLKPHLESLLSDLNMSYPNRIIDMNTWRHDRWDAVGNYLCENLGYSSAYVFLNAYGFEVYEASAGYTSVSCENPQPVVTVQRMSNSMSNTQPISPTVTNNSVSANTHPIASVSPITSSVPHRSSTRMPSDNSAQDKQFCMICGVQLPSSALVCNKCGCPTQNHNQSIQQTTGYNPSRRTTSINIDKGTLRNSTKYFVRFAIVFGCVGLIPLVFTLLCLGHSAVGAIICGSVTILFMVVIAIIVCYASKYKKLTAEYNTLSSINDTDLSSAASLSSLSKIIGIISLFFSIATIPGWIISLICIKKLKGYTTTENKVGFICSSISLCCAVLSPLLISLIFFPQIYYF